MAIETKHQYESMSKRGERRKTGQYSQLTQKMANAITDSGYSFRQLGEMSGIHHRTISDLVNGRRDGSVQSWNDILQAAGIELGYRITK